MSCVWHGTAMRITNFGSIFLKLFDKISGNLFGILLYVQWHTFYGLWAFTALIHWRLSQGIFWTNVEINQSLCWQDTSLRRFFKNLPGHLCIYRRLRYCPELCSRTLLLQSRATTVKCPLWALPSALFNIVVRLPYSGFRLFSILQCSSLLSWLGNPDIDQRIGYQGRACALP